MSTFCLGGYRRSLWGESARFCYVRLTYVIHLVQLSVQTIIISDNFRKVLFWLFTFHFFSENQKSYQCAFQTNGKLSTLLKKVSSNYWWVVLEFCPQEAACKIPVPKWSYQGDALVSHLHFDISNFLTIKFWKFKFFKLLRIFWNIWKIR